jgi:DNA-binding NarL/FixJ family response regulator
MPIGLVLADDHPVVLRGLEQLFGRERDFAVLARCQTGEETLRAVRQHRPDVLILDIRMPGMDGLAVLRELKARKLPTRVVLLTAELDEHEAMEAIRLGVRGMVLKETAPQLLVQCVRKVHGGEQWLERRSVGRALDRLLRREAGGRQLAEILTTRELQIVRMVARGVATRQIAQELSLSEGTVKVHLHHIYEKLHVDGRVALTVVAHEKGLA